MEETGLGRGLCRGSVKGFEPSYISNYIPCDYSIYIGLHFPGPFVFENNFGLLDILIWVTVYSCTYILTPLVWLQKQGFKFSTLWCSINWKRDIWIILFFWFIDIAGALLATPEFFELNVREYFSAIPFGILVNTLGAGLPVLIMIHLIALPRLSVLIKNQFTVVFLGGLFYSLFSMFDQGVDYSTWQIALTTIAYTIATQTLIGMGKSVFTVKTGNPFIHYVTIHVWGARLAFDTFMYSIILNRL